MADPRTRSATRRGGRRRGSRRRLRFGQSSRKHRKHPSQPSSNPSQDPTEEIKREPSASGSAESGEISEGFGVPQETWESGLPDHQARIFPSRPRNLSEPAPQPRGTGGQRRELFPSGLPNHQSRIFPDGRPQDLFDPAPQYRPPPRHRRELFEPGLPGHQARIFPDASPQGPSNEQHDYKPQFASEHDSASGASPPPMMDRESRSRRYDDGEVTRYGAGESYRPFNSNRSPRRARSPPRGRSPPMLDSDRYIPGRSPRRRSRSGDRYRRDLSRDRRETRGMGDSWRGRDRSRSLRRSPPRRSPPRRSPGRRSPPPRRFSPRRDDRDRLRSPRRGFESRFQLPQDDPNYIRLTNIPYRRRSRSPFERDRIRDRTPPRRSPPPVPRASTYRARSRSPERRDDRYGPSYSRRPSPPRDSALSSAIPSQNTSRRSSPRPLPPHRDDRSRPQSPIPSRPLSRSSYGLPTRERSPQGTPKEPPVPRSPPRGPAALRAPPTGPRDTRTYGGQSGGAIGPPPRPAPAVPATSNRPDISPGGPPAGPRGYVPSRGGGYGRGGRGGPSWGSTIQSRNLPPTAGPVSASATTSSSTIPTGPRAGPTSQSVPSTPVNASKPFNPPKGPAAESNRPSLANQLLSTVSPIIPGGKADQRDLAMQMGVLPELLPHHMQLKEEEEKLRAEKYVKEEKLRKSLAMWDKFEREAKVLDLRLELSENLMKKFAGDGVGGAAF
ncbi:hypothetical protein K449DRAFT_403758 [Hypoxylon sp. EC38]|nr:hypothetical protein K449DRAFT_403758 [Hypoxylon sp. EC38]